MSISIDKDDSRANIEKTAYYPALMRAIDSVSENRLVYDPASLLLVPAEMFDIFYAKCPAFELQKTFVDFHAFRARAISEVLVTPDVLPQTVILGAGLDTLAWRECQLKDVYEIDQSEMFINKSQKLPKTVNQGKHCMIQADLASDQWAQTLVDSGFNPLLPTAWVMEGLLYYCTTDTTHRIFQTIDRLSLKGSRLFFDHWPSSYLQTGLEVATTLFRSFMDHPMEEFQWFRENGWSMTKMIDFGENGEHYGRRHETLRIKGTPLALYFISASKTK